MRAVSKSWPLFLISEVCDMTQGQVGRSELFSLDSGDHWLLFEFNRRH